MNKVTLSSVVALLLLLTGAAVVVDGFLPPRTSSSYDLAGWARPAGAVWHPRAAD